MVSCCDFNLHSDMVSMKKVKMLSDSDIIASGDQLDFLDELKICEHVWFYRDWGEPHRHLNYSICVKCGKKIVSDKKAKVKK